MGGLLREGEPSSRPPRRAFRDDFQLCTELRSAASVEGHGGDAGNDAEYIASVLSFFDVTMNPGVLLLGHRSEGSRSRAQNVDQHRALHAAFV